MRPLALAVLLAVTGFLPQLTSAQSANITFKASLKSFDSTSLSNVYVKIYDPEKTSAVDSLFSDEAGNIDRQLPFPWSGTPVFPWSMPSPGIVKQMAPNVISAANARVHVEYMYPHKATLFFTDIHGKRHINGSLLPSGLYFYYMEFDDGYRTDMYKMLLTEQCRVSVALQNRYRGVGNISGNTLSGGHQLKAAPREEKFIVSMVKEGFRTLVDTVRIDGEVIVRNYQMEPVDPPSAAFSWSGELLTGQPVLFDATASTGAYGEVLIYSWDFGDGRKGQSGRIPHIFTTAGTYEVRLTVSGNYGAVHQVSKTINITPQQVATQFAGIVIASVADMDGQDLKDARIALVEDGSEVYTDQRGMALMEELPLNVPLHFRITKEGYVTQVAELTIPETTEEAVFFTNLKARAPGITLSNAEFGGSKTGADGASFTLPVNGLVKDDGSVVKGDVQVSITPVDVAYDAAAFPGSFTGYRADGEDGVLLSYGVAEYHFEQDGEKLQMAAGKKAVIEIPVYTSGAAPGYEIPLWSVDEESGIWVEEGTGIIVVSDASPTGLAYRAEIGHLSWWNCDDWEDEKKRDGLCYRLECTSAICVRVKVGCWVSGAMRDKKKSAIKSIVAREDIPPVFEVREFIPETGMNLRFPATRDVLVDARAFGPGNQLLGGSYVVEASDPSDTFAIELVPLVAGDTIDLDMNSIGEHYLAPDEILTFRVEIPSADTYRIYAEPGEQPRLYGIFSVYQEGEVLLTGDIGTEEHWVDAQPGELFIAMAGQQATSEGNFLAGISERAPILAGDTLALELNSPFEGFLNASEYMHFEVDIPTPGLYRVDLTYGTQPALRGRFEVYGAGPGTYRFLTTDDHGYIRAEEGRLIMSVAGVDLKAEGNFIIGIWEINASALLLNDSVYAHMAETDTFHMFSIQSPVNTLVDFRFNHVDVSFVSGGVSLVSPSGKILDEGYLYNPGERIVSPLARDSVYYLEVERYNSTFDYVLLTEEDASIATAYGDTLEERLRYKGDKDMYHFTGTAGDVVSIQGFQPDYQLSKGYFSLWDEEGRVLAAREISYNNTSNDYEIVYDVSETGEYSLIVGSHRDDTGSYQLILQKITPLDILMEEITEMEVVAGKTYYAAFESAESKLIHLSILSDNGSGYFHLWDASGNRLTEFYVNRDIRNVYSASYTGFLDVGRYFIRIDNASANRVYLNLLEPGSLQFDEKGKAAFIDTIHQPLFSNAYSFKGKRGDGIHAILKKNAEEPAPDELELHYFRTTGAGRAFYPVDRSGGYYSLDESFLHESGASLSGEFDDTLFVAVAFGRTTGTYHFTFHHVEASAELTVDDDFMEYPSAQTASHIAAGYAIREPGVLTIANGVYTSMLPMQIESDYVTLGGQEEEGVVLRNVYNHSSSPVINLNSEGANINHLTLSCGLANYYAIESLYGGVTMDHLHIKPLEGNIEVAGGIKGGGNDYTLSNITMTHSIWGIKLGSNGGLIENCNLVTKNQAIEFTGDDIVIRNNEIEVTNSNRAIATRAGYHSSGPQLIEGNTIHMTREGYTDGNGIINVENFTRPDFTTATVIRNNTIHSAGNNAAFFLTLGNPPSTITVENNSYYGTGPGGGKALALQAGRSDGVSSVFVRNNTFSGLQSESSVILYGAEYINADERFAIYNNNFRLAPDAETTADLCFVEARASGYTFKDTSSIYLVNNIFAGNGNTSLLKCSDAFSLYADYNTVYNFTSYLGGTGNIIGTTHDVTGDPLYTDDDLHIGPTSPAINKGADPSLFPGIPTTGKDGAVRPQGTGYDMGAYEQ